MKLFVTQLALHITYGGTDMTTTNESSTSKPADGGPAFPSGLTAKEVKFANGRVEGAYVSEFASSATGLSLRDYFASKAMGAFCQGSEGLGDAPEEKVRDAFESAARFAYMAADSMLKARG
ncbi:hypothetical protein [Burkholderia glumae]